MGMRYSSGFSLENLRQNLFSRQRKFNKDMHTEVEAGAELIMKKSQANTPIDTYNLEEAHHIQKTRTAADNVRFTIEVSGMGYGSDDPRDVSNYAMEVHENYENMGSGGHPKAGSKTAAKKLGNPDVGSKFLEKAIESEKPEVIEKVRGAVRRNFVNKGRR
jgi:nanoRNase/pAp phosphatase (c-di-AMP/oligoRNAs hydrolase)